MNAWRASGLLGASHHRATSSVSLHLSHGFCPTRHPPKGGQRDVRSGAERSGAGGSVSGWGGRQGLPGDGVGRGIITFVGFVSRSFGALSRLFAYLQRRSLEDWAPYASVASYVLPRCL